jgi:hypothetical protein
VKQVKDSNDSNTIRQALNGLQSAMHALQQHLSRGGGPTPGGGAPPSGDGKGGKEDVIDAEFEVKK